MPEIVATIGASEKKDRFAHMAITALMEHGHKGKTGACHHEPWNRRCWYGENARGCRNKSFSCLYTGAFILRPVLRLKGSDTL